MKTITNIEDLKRVIRIKDLINKNELNIDYISLLSKYIGEDYSYVKNLFVLKHYEPALKTLYVDSQKNSILALERYKSDFNRYLKNRVSQDVFHYFSSNQLYIKENQIYVECPFLNEKHNTKVI